MGFIDAIYILDNTQFPVLHYKFKPDVPSFNYIRNQILAIKRELLSKSGYISSSSSNNFSGNVSFDYMFDSFDLFNNSGGMNNTANSDDYVLVDPVLKLDSDWIVSWCKCDGLYFLTLGSARPEFLDVVSDDENEEDDDEDEEDDDEDEEDDDNGDEDEEQDDESVSSIPNSTTNHRFEYSSLSDDEDKKESDEENEEEFIPEEESVHEEQSVMKNKVSEHLSNTPSVSTISNSPNPLQYIQFLDVLAQAIKLMLQTTSLSSHKIQLNSHRIIMLLQELLDGSVPFISDMNQLRELLPNDSVIDKIVSSAKQIQNTAVSSISSLKNGSISNIRNDLHNQLPNSSISQPSTFTYSTILERSGNKTPWRSANIKTAQNEIFLDLYETIDLIVQPKIHKSRSYKKYTNYSAFGNNNFTTYNNNDISLIKANINGHIDLTTSLVGDPTIEIQLSNPLNSFSSRVSLDNCYPSLHRAINKKIWRDSDAKVVQLVPPNEKCKLLKYNIDLLELNEEEGDGNLDLSKYCGLINVELHSGLGINRNEFEVVVNTGCGLNAGFGTSYTNSNNNSTTTIAGASNGGKGNLQSSIEDLVIELFLPTSTSLDINSDESKQETQKIMNGTKNSKKSLVDKQGGGTLSSYGANQSNSTNAETGKLMTYDLKVLRSSTGTITRSVKGNYEWKLDSEVVVGGVFTLRGCIGTDDNDIEQNNEEVDNMKKKRKLISPRFLRVHYKHLGSLPSGLKVQGIKVVSGGSKVKPFKGVKYTTQSGDFIVR
ncbi:hypothetical protein C6P40_002963 [Pichia californica]|uniref:MHD domain-containing protein n=1 Tax=Pichia californica TaxID=460514 RepID=A0A9P7BEW1_9ASCO|nr:hypothetical protein C6P42_002628 [[Candida] californica]KAG0687049.1 hypothetical protein C6P40_002963 [[Candida] californica]